MTGFFHKPYSFSSAIDLENVSVFVLSSKAICINENVQAPDDFLNARNKRKRQETNATFRVNNFMTEKLITVIKEEKEEESLIQCPLVFRTPILLAC